MHQRENAQKLKQTNQNQITEDMVARMIQLEEVLQKPGWEGSLEQELIFLYSVRFSHIESSRIL